MVEATARIASHHIDQLRRSCAEVIAPEDAGYDEARLLWNAIQRRPAVIARPSTAEEVAIAIRFARDHDLEITVRSGGHSAAGLGGANGGLLVDMSGMRGVEVDPRTRTARANGGALLGELDVAAQVRSRRSGRRRPSGVAGLTLVGVGRLSATSG
jgi:FAD/FMN-containing dehydrogenase